MGSPTAEFFYCVILWLKYDQVRMLSRAFFVDTVRVHQVQSTSIYRPLFCFDYRSCDVQILCTLISGYARWHQRAKQPPKTDVIKKFRRGLGDRRVAHSWLCTLGHTKKMLYRHFLKKIQTQQKRFYRDLNSDRWIQSPEC